MKQPNARRAKGVPMGGRPTGMTFKSLKRVIKMLFSFYPVMMPLTVVCILFSSATSAIPAIFMQNVIAEIEKWVDTGDWASAKEIIVPRVLILIGLYVLSIIAITVYTQLMAYMTQGFLSKMRCAMFGGMQNLPIKYFDTNRHGDIMSHYTNDIDTLRQLVSQSLPSLIQASAVVLCVFFIMLYYSVWLTLLVIAGVSVMLFVAGKFGGGSAKFFIRQQQSVGKAEGFIQEMMNGQKVIKVFCQEEKSKADIEKINDAL